MEVRSRGVGFVATFSRGAWCMKILWGACAWCGLILGGELMLQFSLRPGCQLVSLLLDVGLRPLHGSIIFFFFFFKTNAQ